MGEKEEKKEDVASSEKEETFLGFNKELIPCKLMFFVLDASFSSLFSFLGLYYLSVGLTVTQLGLVNAIGSIFSLLSHPVWGGLVDSAIKHRTLLMVTLAMGTTVLEFGKPWLVMFISRFHFVVKCAGAPTAAAIILNTTVLNQSLNHIGKNCTATPQLLNGNTVFYAVVINGVCSSVCISGLMTYMEGAIIKTVFTRKTEHSYGEQKVFGPIGMALGSFIAGVAVDHYKPKHLSHFLAAFYVYLPFSLMMIPILYILTKQAKWDYGTTKKDERRKSLTDHIISSFRHRDNIMFIASVFMMGIASNVYGHYHYIYMYQKMNPSKTILSLTTVLSSLSEIIVYPFSSKLIRLMGGHLRLMIIGCALQVVRLVLFTYCPNAYWVLPLSLSGGLTSLIWTAMIEHTWAIFPKEMTNTAIGILMSFSYLAPSIISNIFGAILYRKFGAIRLLRGTAIFAAFWFAMMVLYFEGWRKGKAVSLTNPKEPKVQMENGIENKIHMELEEGRQEKNVV